MQETQVQSLGQADPLEKGVATHPVFLPGEFHGEMSLVGYTVRGVAKSWMQLSIHPFFIAILKTEPIAILSNSCLSLCLPQACPWRMRGQKEIHRWPPTKAPSIYCHVGALTAWNSQVTPHEETEHLWPCGSVHSVELSGHLPRRHRASLAMRECSQRGNEPLSAFFTWASPLQGPLFPTCSPVEVQCQSAGANTVYVSVTKGASFRIRGHFHLSSWIRQWKVEGLNNRH